MSSNGQVVSAARFYLDFANLGRIAFSELGGISSKVSAQEYIYNDDTGKTVHTKQYGKTEPPTISLKRGLDTAGNLALMTWHAMARRGDPMGRGDGKLFVMDAAEPSPSIQLTYDLHNAWCSELTISGMKAGDSAVVMIEVKVTCEEIRVV
ncbi:phage tail protein [Actinokineospora bangkokensis]|uniref:Phage tail protein n=1 Tax=Actinokineospora bangkokensis TaxID=1193682 RepID=A0A1Q9LLH0_9PSEU|nr:phage tail protein [Actinokineospora bangkokensis]OLR92870.1 hypothetical protein BJP25_19285 [Actinokineospora bangkokensis]